jgi:hypothetical protein
MTEFFNSKFIQDLKDGKLPPVEVQFSTKSLIQVSVTAIITAVIIVLAAQIFKNL